MSEDERTLPIDLPAELLPRYSLQSEQYAAEDIVNYVNGQAPDETVLNVEFIKEEPVLGKRYKVWDVTTDLSRWWVITNLTNLYSQEFFKSLDYTLSFHIGLMARLSERQGPSEDEKSTQFAEIERRQRAIHDSFDLAEEAVDFQQIGLQLREQLLRLVSAISIFVPVLDGQERPKKGDFKALKDQLVDCLFAGKRKQALRKFLKSSSNDAWEIVNWLTHAQNADQKSTLMAMQSVDALIGHFLFALVGYEDGEAVECPECNSRRLNTHYDVNLGDDGEYFQSCQGCNWTSRPK